VTCTETHRNVTIQSRRVNRQTGSTLALHALQQPRRDRESFRKTLVDIILLVHLFKHNILKCIMYVRVYPVNSAIDPYF